MNVIFRSKQSDPQQSGDAPTSGGTGAETGPDGTQPVGKGRPTPSRKEAEAARKQNLRVPSDPKEAKKAAKERASAERSAARAALLTGDEKHLSGRDAGPVKAHVRQFVDSRRSAGELFLPIALVVLAIGFIREPRLQQIVTYVWMAVTIFMIVDTTILLMRLSSELKAKWPEKSERKGAMWYATMRVIQLRKLRLPPPKVRPGGKPVVPKVKK